MVEAVEPFKLHPTSILYKFRVFEHLLLWWMGIWMHTYMVTNKSGAPDHPSYVNVQMMPQRYGRGCRTSQIASCTYILYKFKVFEDFILWWMGIWMQP